MDYMHNLGTGFAICKQLHVKCDTFLIKGPKMNITWQLELEEVLINNVRMKKNFSEKIDEIDFHGFSMDF